mgnify:CR=1 FL=1
MIAFCINVLIWIPAFAGMTNKKLFNEHHAFKVGEINGANTVEIHA